MTTTNVIILVAFAVYMLIMIAVGLRRFPRRRPT